MLSSRFMMEILPYLNESLASKVDSVPWRSVPRPSAAMAA
jgi:hypothetical protein